MPSDWKILANKGKKIGLKYGKEGFKFAKQAAAESGLLGSYTIGGKEVVELKKLASGGFASVKLVRDVNTNEEYALKKIKCLQGRSQVACTNEEAEREARLISRISHPNVIKCIAWGRRESSKRGVTEILMMLELCSEGHLGDYIHKNKGILRPKDIVDCLFDTTDAVHFLHNWQRVPLCHRDIKIENILRHKSGTWKICDFGSMCCRNVIYPKELSKKGVMDLQDEIEKKVTMLYRPPEMVDLQFSRDDTECDWPISTPVDLWMIGCVLYCMLFGQHPFKDAATPLAIRAAKYYLPRNHPNMNLKNLMLLAQWLMSPRPEDRPDTEKLLDLLEEWQSQPDLFDQLPADTQDRLQKSWNLYGLKFSGVDRSSEGVFRKSRYQFVAKNDDLMKKSGDGKGRTESKDTGRKPAGADAAPVAMPNLLDFDDNDAAPAAITTNQPPPSCDLLGFDMDDDSGQPTPIASDGFGGSSGSAAAFDPFAVSSMASNDPFGAPSAVVGGPARPSGGDPFAIPGPPAASSDPFGAPILGDPFGAPASASGGAPFGAPAPAPTLGGDPFGGIGIPTRPSGGDPYGAVPASVPAAGNAAFDPFSFTSAPGPAVPTQDAGGIPFLAPPSNTSVPFIPPQASQNQGNDLLDF